MLQWAYFPRSAKPTSLALDVVNAFDLVMPKIASEHHRLPSNSVLAEVATNLFSLGFKVESGKKKSEKIPVPSENPIFLSEHHSNRKAYDLSDGI